ncbi:hypothetical protein SAMN05444483_1138 [Salegentibacter echinorum]|uniref:Lipoprotein n=1 Tax=Salegentibacter echinorum TaxID=1073325 RepID=A0A1M5K0X4_SALEC|nr:hypothetical protein SAMN05444483_1138 [Salegentibacter echinorum]
MFSFIIIFVSCEVDETASFQIIEVWILEKFQMSL